VEAELRCLPGPRHTGVMGSSMGGLFSFMAAWDRPEIYGLCGAISATFSRRPELFARVEQEEKRAIRFYLDSGSPLDNFEETRRMRDLLTLRGYAQGADLLALTFPGALHNEHAWGSRICVPFQFLFGD
jgi:predicted alpha/beta superfamily hydrolase